MRLFSTQLPTRSSPSVFTGKSRALQAARAWVPDGTIPSLLSFTLDAWHADRDAVLARCAQVFGAQWVAVRSDASDEDAMHASNAGAYTSLLDVRPEDRAQAIDAVAAQLGRSVGDQVMVQAMVRGVGFAGVAATHRVADGAPWYCVEMAPHDSAAVTSGRSSGRHTAVARAAIAELLDAPPQDDSGSVREVLGLLCALERACGLPLEMEFAWGCVPAPDGSAAPPRLHLLQLRPLATQGRWSSGVAQAVRMLPPLDLLDAADGHAAVHGRSTVLSLMADWNPAELLGAHPRPLALSLFRHLIGDGVWWRARAALGYAQVPQHGIELLRILSGRALVDVRRSANSLLPAGLPALAAAQLVDTWIGRLRAQPSLHDKVEFEVLRTVSDFAGDPVGTSPERAALGDGLWTLWRARLHALTADLLAPGAGGPLARCAAAVAAIDAEPAPDMSWAGRLALARRGSFAFAIAARLAFAGEAQLRSAVARGALDPARVAQWKRAAGALPLAQADRAHGHLRPGTMDITQPTWDDSGYQAQAGHGAGAAQHAAASLNAQEARALAALLREARLDLAPADWLAFVQQARVLRERARHVFTRHLSVAMDRIAADAERHGLARETLSWLSLAQWEAAGRQASPAGWRSLEAAAARACRQHADESTVVVAPVLAHARDRWMADSQGVLPNFIGSQAVQGPVRCLHDARARGDGSLAGAIVVVEQADPGFDWLFSCGIGGLVTAWGGANSHMAVRCAELGIAAAIGCGEHLYRQVRDAATACIDPVAGGLWLR